MKIRRSRERLTDNPEAKNGALLAEELAVRFVEEQKLCCPINRIWISDAEDGGGNQGVGEKQ